MKSGWWPPTGDRADINAAPVAGFRERDAPHAISRDYSASGCAAGAAALKASCAAQAASTAWILG